MKTTLPIEGVETKISQATAHLVRVPEAARITGLPKSLIKKSFICEKKRPKNVPSPPPHKRIGRSVYILADKLSEWVKNLEEQTFTAQREAKRRKGRPTVAERIARRQSEGS